MTLLQGDCLERLKGLADNSVDSIVTDPPYGLSFMGKKWDYDVPTTEIWAECLRVLKPGGHLLAACGTRTQHRMAVRIEDAGFEIRDVICWHYGSGFPKSLDVSKAIDKKLGVFDEREITHYNKQGTRSLFDGGKARAASLPASLPASEWQGWGTALKPATEFFTMARKPLEKGLTVAENVLKYGTGALNIDASRIEGQKRSPEFKSPESELGYHGGSSNKNLVGWDASQGRWPANVILDEFQEPVLRLKDSVNEGIRQTIEVFYASYGQLQNLQKENDNISESQESEEILQQGMLLQGFIETPGANDREETFRQINCKNETETCENWTTESDMERPLVFEGLQTRKYQSTISGEVENTIPNVAERSGFTTGTSHEDGSQIRKAAEALGGCSPQEWNQGRQSSSKSRIKRHQPSQKGTLASIERGKETSCLVRESDVPQVWLQYFENSGFTIRSGSAAVLDKQTKNQRASKPSATGTKFKATGSFPIENNNLTSYDDSGGASRFFYVAKASKKERNAGLEGFALQKTNDGRQKEIDNDFQRGTTERQNHHPTVKPVKLMEYLINLVTPLNGSVLDPFMGSGSTGVAAKKLNRDFIGIELSPEYFEIAKKRIGA